MGYNTETFICKNNTKIQVNYGVYFEQTMGYNTGIFICKNNTKIQVNYGIHFEQTMGSEVLSYLLFFNGLLSFKFLNSSQFYHHNVLIIICQNP